MRHFQRPCTVITWGRHGHSQRWSIIWAFSNCYLIVARCAVHTDMLFAETRCMMETARSEQVSEPCSTIMHCSAAGEPCPTIPAVKLADGAGIVCRKYIIVWMHNLTIISKVEFMYVYGMCMWLCTHEIKSISKYFCHIHYSFFNLCLFCFKSFMR